MCDDNSNQKTTNGGGNYTTNSAGNYTTTTFFTGIWKCLNCGNCVEERCGECGHKKFKCLKLNILVEEDFYCKYYCSKTTSQPYTPQQPYEPIVWCTNTDDQMNVHYNYFTRYTNRA